MFWRIFDDKGRFVGEYDTEHDFFLAWDYCSKYMGYTWRKYNNESFYNSSSLEWLHS